MEHRREQRKTADQRTIADSTRQAKRKAPPISLPVVFLILDEYILPVFCCFTRVFEYLLRGSQDGLFD